MEEIFLDWKKIKKENRVIRDLRNLFEHEEEENYYKPVRVSRYEIWKYESKKYESNSDRNKTLSAEEYLNKIRPYLKGIINNIEKTNMGKIQLTVVFYFISFKDNDEECVMHSKSEDLEIKINDKAVEVIEKLF